MQVDREGERLGHLSPFCDSIVYLVWSEWRGEQGCRRVYSQRRRFQYACQRVGSDSALDVLFRFFGRSIFPERRAGGGVICSSLPSAAALLVCMPAGGRTCAWNIVYFALSLFFFEGLGERGWKRGRRLSSLSGCALGIHAKGSGEERTRLLISRLWAFRFPGVMRRGQGFQRLPTSNSGAAGMHTSG